ncbi:hypothetical protein ACLQ2R_03150 [Streptosporangium sp. DT93]|uniref:hypothetical protein n=1 Tax=Streptosporangium sp. DT93 TaxID=3393428 RepID=UPI003CEE3AFF
MRDRTALRGRARRELEVRAACEAEEDALLAAKEAAAADPSPENVAAKRAAMESYAETRAWLRAVARIAQARREVVTYATATDAKGTAKRLKAEADLERLPRLYGPLIAAMEELAGTSPAVDPPDEPPGSVAVTPARARGRGRFGKDGA